MKKQEVLKLIKTETAYEIQLGDKTTGEMCPDEALGFIAHNIFRSIEREHLFGLKDIPAKDKNLQEYLRHVRSYPANNERLTDYIEEVNKRLFALEAKHES